MEIYKLTFKSLSSITKIPDAQTIFGSVCTILNFTKGENAVQEYIGSFDKEPFFVHSSMFIDNILPLPKIGLISIVEKNDRIFKSSPEEQLKQLSNLKKLKKVNYLTIDLYQEYIEKGLFEQLKKDILSNKLSIENGIVSKKTYDYLQSSQLVIHNNKEEVNNDSRKLYYDNNVYYDEKTRFCIYIKTKDINYVQSIFKYSQYFGFGNRISVGKNCFELEKITKIKQSNSIIKDKVILLSKCTSTEFILEESSYMIESQVYQGSKYYSSNKIGRFNHFLEGSYMKVKDNKEYYGEIIKCNNGKPIYHYGIGFVL